MTRTTKQAAQRRLGRIAAVLALVGALLGALPGPTVVQAADPMGPTADQAVQLVDRPLSGHLDANASGSFAFYKFWYPADGTTATVKVDIVPDDIFILQHAGIY